MSVKIEILGTNGWFFEVGFFAPLMLDNLAITAQRCSVLKLIKGLLKPEMRNV